MAEIRCPMCGKENPADLEVCQHCGARLRPLIARPYEEEASPSEAEPMDASQSDENASDLFSEFSKESGLHESAQGELPDWLRSLRPETEEASPPEEEDESVLEESELPDWLRSPSPTKEEQAEESSAQAFTELDEGEPVLEEGELPDWLRGPSPAEEEQAGEAASEQDFLPELEAEPNLEEGELPDWLRSSSSIEAERAAEAATEESFEPGFEEGELPEWLQSSSSIEDEQAQATPFEEASRSEIEESEPVFEEGELPDWLRSATLIDGEQAGEAASEQVFPAESEESELEAAVGAQVDPFEEPAGPFTEDSFPSLDLGDSEAPPADTGEQEPQGEPAGAQIDTEEPASTEPEEDDLSEIGLGTGAAVFSEAAPDLDLDWLKEEAGDEPREETPPEKVAPFVEDYDEVTGELEEAQLPAWLTESAEGQEADESSAEPVSEGSEQEAEAPAESSLDEARIPGWLAAMRPVETAAPPEPVKEGPEEEITSGPLSGLKGILPAEPEVARAKRAPVYSVKLQVAETQSSHAKLFTDLIEGEGSVPHVPRKAAVSSSQFLRLLIFLILLAAVLWPVLIRSQSIPLPLFTNEINDTGQLIGTLPQNAPVLLAVDFEPGFSGELEAAADAVVDHLMRQGAYLAVVSTSPTGPLQAERLLSGLNLRNGHNYTSLGQYANLGFVPGGPGGLRSFAEAPRQMLPFSMGSEGTAADRAWRETPLREVERLSDFSMAVVLTEDPDTARAWIEQAQPMLGSAPLILVTSSQADPLVRSYYEGQSDQVQGLVSGLAGGAAYERFTTRNGLARQAWDAYAFTLPVAAVLIFLGALLSIISQSLDGRRRSRRSAGSRR